MADARGSHNFIPRPVHSGSDIIIYNSYPHVLSGAPCLSFDILPDLLGDSRESYPMTSYLVCGTQAERSHTNSVIVMKLYNMHQCVE
mgnify:CR=1 FL=1